MYLTEIRREGMDWIYLTQEKNTGQAVVYTVIYFLVL